MGVLRDDGQGALAFYCPGCKHSHVYFVTNERNFAHVWGFNNDMQRPTFTPSLLNRWGKNVDPNWEEPEGEGPEGGWSGICHLFVTNGQIMYCSDSTHSLAGKTVPMVDYDTIKK